MNKRDLSNSLSLVNRDWNEATLCPPEKRTNAQCQILVQSDALIAELKCADIVIVGAPMYNFSIGTGLKAWIDLIVLAGEPFKYTQSGPIGLLSDKPVYIIITTGGTVLGGNFDYASNYLTHIFRFMGINNLTIIDDAKYNTNNSDDTLQNHKKIRDRLITPNLLPLLRFRR